MQQRQQSPMTAARQRGFNADAAADSEEEDNALNGPQSLPGAAGSDEEEEDEYKVRERGGGPRGGRVLHEQHAVGCCC
jgi:hypothetical protein